MPDAGKFQTVRSLSHGILPVEGQGNDRSVVLPDLREVDLLVLE
jgi:hypothetical protein